MKTGEPNDSDLTAMDGLDKEELPKVEYVESEVI